jgi:hypothetical protein
VRVDTLTDTNCHGYADPDPNTYTNSDAYTNANPNSNTNTSRDSNAYPVSDTRCANKYYGNGNLMQPDCSLVD